MSYNMDGDQSQCTLSSNGEDVYSDSNVQEIRVIGMHVDWSFFKNKCIIDGHVVLDVQVLESAVTQLKLDVDAGLSIGRVYDVAGKEKLVYTEKEQSYVDKTLIIELSSSIKRAGVASIMIEYKKASKDGLHSYKGLHGFTLLSKFEYLRARKLFPCQDDPTNAVLFSAKVHVKNTLNVLMSAPLEDEKRGANIKTLFFVNPKPVPLYAIGFVVGSFRVTKLTKSIVIYHQREIKMDINKIPQYVDMISELVGPDPWRKHQIVLLRRDVFSTYPYLYIWNENISSESILHSLAYNWFRSTITISNINDLWLHEAFPLYVARQLAYQLTEAVHIEAPSHASDFSEDSDDTEDTQHAMEMSNEALYIEQATQQAAEELANEELVFKPAVFNNSDQVELLAEKAWLCLVILDHYGGRYGEFECVLRQYYENSKFRHADLRTLVQLSDQCLHFGDEQNHCVSKAHERVSKVDDWIQEGAPIPAGFQKAIEPYADIVEAIEWLVQEGRELKRSGKKAENSAFKASPLGLFRPKCVHHRSRKMLLLHTLQKVDRDRLEPEAFEILSEQLGMSCAQDEQMLYEFARLLIQCRQVQQLEAIRTFTANCSNIRHLIDIERELLLWQEESQGEGESGEQDEAHSTVRWEIIKLCDEKLEELVSEKENKMRHTQH